MSQSREDRAAAVLQLCEFAVRGVEIEFDDPLDEPSLVHMLPGRILLLLGAKTIDGARNHKSHPKWEHDFIGNLKSCLVEGDDCAFPGFKIKNNSTGNAIGGHKGFKGDYLDF